MRKDDTEAEEEQPEGKRRESENVLFHPSPGVEIDLRGMNSEEITDLLDKYLDDAALAGLPYVRITMEGNRKAPSGNPEYLA